MPLLRAAAHDGALVQIFADSLEHHSLVEGGRLGESAMPLLLGLAVTRTVQKGVGERSLALRERLEQEGAWLPASGVPTDAGVAAYRSMQLPSVSPSSGGPGETTLSGAPPDPLADHVHEKRGAERRRSRDRDLEAVVVDRLRTGAT